MKKIFLSIVFSVVFTSIYACTCIPQKLVEAMERAQFVATAKISKVVPDPSKPDTKIVTIELINVYKGERVTTLYINTEDRTSCAFELPVNSTWLFFAGKNADGTIGFGACSKSEQIDRRYPDSLQYPNAMRNYRRSIDFKLEVLAYLRDHRINPVNPYQVNLRVKPDVSENFKGANVSEKEFAVYRIKAGTDLSVQKITPLKEWADTQLRSQFLAFLEKNLKLYTREKGIPQPAEITLIFYAYMAEEGYPSFISELDL